MSNDGMQMAYYNFVTNRYDFRSEPPRDWGDYVPQIGGRGIYNILVSMGKTPEDAALEVLTKATNHYANS